MKTKSIVHHLAQLTFSILAAAFMFFSAGCETNKTHSTSNSSLPPKDSKDIILSEADVLKVTFPGASTLDTVQTIRRDGKITLPLVGEVVAAGKTPADFEKELVELFKDQLVSSKQIIVTVQSSSFPVFVTGAVQKPGKILSNHPMTVLEAIMESGGFDPTANMKTVRIVRNQEKQTKTYTVNLNGIMTGAPIDVFYLQASDIVVVKRKITWF